MKTIRNRNSNSSSKSSSTSNTRNTSNTSKSSNINTGNTSSRELHLSRKRVTLLVAGAVAIVLALTLATAYSYGNKEDRTAVTINGIALPFKLLEAELQRSTPDVYTYFRTQHGVKAEEEDNFWTSTYGGENPTDYARQLVVRQWTEHVVLLELAREHGMIEDIQYEALVDWWQEENRLRQAKLEAGEIVYGPYSYTWDGFIKTQLATFHADLRRLYAANGFKLSEQELRARYEADKLTKYRQDDEVTILQIRLPYYAADPDQSAQAKQAAEASLQEALGRLEAGEDFETVAADYHPNEETAQITFKPEQAYEDAKLDTVVRTAALALDEGEVSEVLHDPLRYFYAIIKAVDKKPGGFVPFEDSQYGIQFTHADSELTRLLEERMARAEIVLQAQ